MREFKIGDKVKDVRFGYGKVKEIMTQLSRPIYVDFGSTDANYYLDGKEKITNPYRSLFHADEEIVVPRPKKKVRIQGWVNRYTDNVSTETLYLHPTEELSRKYWSKDALDKSPFYIDTEVEVEE